MKAPLLVLFCNCRHNALSSVPEMCYTRSKIDGARTLMTHTADLPFYSAAFAKHLQQPVRDPLYHYTSQKGLLGIIESQSLWATNISYMNDATEFELSLELFKDRLFKIVQEKEKEVVDFSLTSPARSMTAGYIKERADLIRRNVSRIKSSSICVTCFCQEGDLLSQWRGYTGGGYGYSLAFRTSDLKTIASNSGFMLGKCIYDPDLQNQIIQESIEYILAEGGPGKPPEEDVKDLISLLQYGAFFKHPSFEQEQEWRFVCPFPEKEHFRQGKSMIIPHTTLKISSGENLCIEQTIVGPCPHKDHSRRSVEQLFKVNRLKPSVSNSSIPFRDW